MSALELPFDPISYLAEQLYASRVFAWKSSGFSGGTEATG
jgi:hypothetical protein